jgi:galactokinase
MKVRAPGRVNLIGGHVDFHEGPVVFAAVDRRVDLELGPPTRPGWVRLTSADFDGRVEIPADGGPDPASVQPPWGRLAAGVLAALSELGRPAVGFDGTVRSNLRIGGGLSSSAAFDVAVAVAAAEAAGWSPAEPMHLAMAAQRAELIATGVPCGIQDPAASVLGGVGLLDCRDLSVERLTIPEGVAVAVLDSGVRRTLESSPWTARREASFEAARQAGVRVLRDATLDQVRDHPQGRHVVEEIDRVWAFADALRAGDPVRAGELMVASHRSSRDLYGSSIPALDELVDQLLRRGAYGARLTGGGFGGCVVALVPDDGTFPEVVGVGGPAGVTSS